MEKTSVRFLKGSQSGLDKIIKAQTLVEGAFYVTEDSHRLYLAESANRVNLLSQAVETYQNLGALVSAPKVEGQFYYLIDENILAICHNGEYVQVNPDVNTTYSLKDQGLSGETQTYALVGSDETNNQIKLKAGTNISFSKEGLDTLVITGAAAGDLELLQSIKSEAAGQGFNITVTDTGNHSISLVDSNTKIDPEIKYGKNKVSAHFKNNIAELNVPSVEEVDAAIEAKLQVANAMTYKGVATVAPSATTQALGFTYKVTAQIEGLPVLEDGIVRANGVAKIGDLLIANSNSGEVEGVIPQGSLYYDIIPSGDDVDDNDTLVGANHADILSADVNMENNKATIRLDKTDIKDTAENTVSLAGAVDIESTGLAFKKTATGISVEMVWGSF